MAAVFDRERYELEQVAAAKESARIAAKYAELERQRLAEKERLAAEAERMRLAQIEQNRLDAEAREAQRQLIAAIKAQEEKEENERNSRPTTKLTKNSVKTLLITSDVDYMSANLWVSFYNTYPAKATATQKITAEKAIEIINNFINSVDNNIKINIKTVDDLRNKNFKYMIETVQGKNNNLSFNKLIESMKSKDKKVLDFYIYPDGKTVDKKYSSYLINYDSKLKIPNTITTLQDILDLYIQSIMNFYKCITTSYTLKDGRNNSVSKKILLLENFTNVESSKSSFGEMSKNTKYLLAIGVLVLVFVVYKKKKLGNFSFGKRRK